MLFLGLARQRVVVWELPGLWVLISPFVGCVQFLAGLTAFMGVMAKLFFVQYPKEVAKYK